MAQFGRILHIRKLSSNCILSIIFNMQNMWVYAHASSVWTCEHFNENVASRNNNKKLITNAYGGQFTVNAQIKFTVMDFHGIDSVLYTGWFLVTGSSRLVGSCLFLVVGGLAITCALKFIWKYECLLFLCWFLVCLVLYYFNWFFFWNRMRSRTDMLS